MTVENMKEMLIGAAPMLLSYALRIVGVLVLLFVAAAVAGWLGKRTTAGMRARKLDKALSQFTGGLVRYMILVAAIIACLGVFGVETTSFAALLGAAALAVGLAFQGTLSNFSAGVMILVFRPFKVDDVIKVAGVVGQVMDIGLFVCALDTADNRRIYIPNSQITGAVIENMSFHELRRVDLDVGVKYGVDLKKVRELLDGVSKGVPGRHKKQGHQIVMTGLGDTSVGWQVRIWCAGADYWAVREAAIEGIRHALDEAGIEAPIPQMAVHLDGALSK
jgi:small conductance mechanosensitive channel